MRYATDAEIKILVEQFEKCAVTPEEWTHKAHLTAGLWYLLHHDINTATNKMRQGIHMLNAAHNVANTPTSGYHETLTVFWTKTIAEFLQNSDETSLVTLANGLLENYPSSYPLKFYSRELLFSPAARAKYIEPDLMQL